MENKMGTSTDITASAGRKAVIYDTTLRDGMQGENIFFSPEDKLKMALRMDDAGIHYIEGGWPGSNPGAQAFFELAKNASFQTGENRGLRGHPATGKDL